MENSRQLAQYADFKREQEELSELISEGSDIVELLDMERFRNDLARLSESVKNDSFKVQIVGTFKNGKSTFINSILGEEIMPAYALPCTAIVNEIKWGETKRAVVHFRDPIPEKLPSGVPAVAMEHINKYNRKEVPPLVVPYDEIEKYAVISLNSGNDEFDFQSPYKKIEVFWPLEILKNGVEIVDSPGLNESLTRTEVTMDYISKADAVLFVLDATRILSADEMTVIDNTIRKQGFSDPFIIINKFDAVRKTEREKMREFIHEKLGSYTDKEFFFVSALNALDGKLDHDDELLRSSGMPEFEKALANYLVKEKGRAKLSRPIRELKRIISEEALFKIIPMQKNALTLSLDEMNEKYESVKPRLNELKHKKQLIFDEFMRKIERARYSFISIATKNMVGLKDEIPVWVNESKPATKLGVVPTKSKLVRASEEIINYLGEQIENHQLAWRNETLLPLITETANKIFDTTQPDVQQFFDSIDDIAMDFSGGSAQKTDTSAWERATNLSGSISMGKNVFSKFGGEVVISFEMIAALTAQVATTVVLGILNVMNPIFLVTILLGSLTVSAVSSESGMMKKLKSSISKDAVEQTTKNAMDFPQEFAQNIINRFIEIAKGISDSMDTEINETENRICGIISDIEKGKENVASREKLLADCEERLKTLITRLDDLSFRLTS